MEGIEKELDRAALIALVRELREENARLRRRIEQLEGKQPTKRLGEAYSLRAEEQRREQAADSSGGKKRRRQKSARRGRRKTDEKLDQAERVCVVLPEGLTIEECTPLRERPVWRIENGRAVLVGYDIYRGPQGQLPRIEDVLPRSEYGLEIHVSVAFLVLIVGLSMDKVCALLKFFWNLALSKSQADALLSQLARTWEGEFESLCQLLAVSTVRACRRDELEHQFGLGAAFRAGAGVDFRLPQRCRDAGGAAAEGDVRRHPRQRRCGRVSRVLEVPEVLGPSAPQGDPPDAAGTGQHRVPSFSGRTAGGVSHGLPLRCRSAAGGIRPAAEGRRTDGPDVRVVRRSLRR